MTAAPHYAALADVIEWRRNAAPGEWVSFAGGDPLDGKHPVVALVRGWHRLGLVEITSDTMPSGLLRHRFQRTKADFPTGWFDPPSAGPTPPPALRDPAAVGVGAMAHFAAAGDEAPDWVRVAAITLQREIGALSAHIHGSKGIQAAAVAALPGGFDRTLAQTQLLLTTLAEMLDADGESARKAQISWRRPGGGQATGSRHDSAMKLNRAAAVVEADVAAGIKKGSAILDAARKSGISDGRISTRLAQNKRVYSWEADRAAADAAQLVQAMTRGGLTQAVAVDEITRATGQEAVALRKAMAKNKKIE